MITGALCLLVGFGIGYILGEFVGWRRQIERRVDPRAVTAGYREWVESGKVSPETMAWLETGVRPR